MGNSNWKAQMPGQVGEIIATAPSGGQKGRKPECYSLIPQEALEEVAKVYGYGAQKYSDHNWRKQYPYSWSLDALYRHIAAFQKLEDVDKESGCQHLAHAVFHLMALITWVKNNPGSEFDDRYKP